MQIKHIPRFFPLFLLLIMNSSLLFSQATASKLSFGVKFRYSDETNVLVESGSDLFGKSVFSIETEGPSGRTPITSLLPAEKAKIQKLMQSIQSLSFNLPYKEQVLQIHGEAVSVELHALSYELTYIDSYERARKQRPIKDLVDTLKRLGIIKVDK